MLDYTKELTLHIQGLSIYFHQAFEEVDKHIDVDIPPGTQVHSAHITKVGGYKPQLLRIIYKSKEGNELQQAYMAKHIDGNLICIPIEEVPIINPFSLERTLPNSPYGIVLYIPSIEVNEKGWLGLYQDGIPWTTRTYRKLENQGITYLET
ncbi:MAG: hypothetical protein ACKPFF_26210 [Planktothrix sp.]